MKKEPLESIVTGPRYLHVLIDAPNGLYQVARFRGLINAIPMYAAMDDSPMSLNEAGRLARERNDAWPKTGPSMKPE